MSSKDILSTSELFTSKNAPPSLYRIKPLDHQTRMLDPVEYGMGFQRGELEEFIDSLANFVLVQEDVGKAFLDGKWVLVPEEEHLKYLTRLWWNNLGCAPDKRERYIPPKNDLAESETGIIFYPYDLFRVESFHIYDGDGTLTQNGVTRVWSSIPPYIWAVCGAHFLIYDDHFKDIPARLAVQTGKLMFVDNLLKKTAIPRIFISSKPDLPQRPYRDVVEAEEAQPQNVL